jgi:hypothetical protein
MEIAKNAFAALNAQVVVSAYARGVRGHNEVTGEISEAERRESRKSNTYYTNHFL